MPSRKKLVDNVRRITPAIENWQDRPAADLPAKVTVAFSTGLAGILDMKNARAVHWAKIIDRLIKANEPVYTEIDEETSVITNLLIPRIYKVEALNTDDHGDVVVRLIPSHAIHFLLKSDPDFESLRTALQAALSNGSELLITETRDEHEIIDIRSPTDITNNPSGTPSSPPDDPPISQARAQDLYNAMNAESCDPCNPSSDCIPFEYPDDGCWARAHKMCYLMVNDHGEDPKKVWITASTILNAPTSNHPDCRVYWGWHVAPILTVSTSTGDLNYVIDPSLSPTPESEEDWKSRQGDPGATLQETPWTNYYGGSSDPDLSQTNDYLAFYRDLLQDRCLEFGPPPYSCTKKCFFIIDRNTFSNYEVEAMIYATGQALIQAAFYIVLDGYSPYELGFTSPTMELTPALSLSSNVSGMTLSVDRLEFEYPTHLNRRQRLTWVYNIEFVDTTGFSSDRVIIKLEAAISSEASTGYIFLIHQPNPYELDGEIAWLSTDLRVFQIKAGESKFGVNAGTDPCAFIAQVINNLNSNSTSGQTFESDISVDPQTSRLELSQTVGGTPVYNFALAKVRYRSLAVPATGVKVLFRLFPVATTSLAYNEATTYRRFEQVDKVVPLLGIESGELVSIPCFAAPRINSATTSMTFQTDPANEQTIQFDTSGNEIVQYFGCYLDINQTQPQFPNQPSPADGPFTAGRKSIQDLIRNEHQCLVSEIAFTPAPVQNGSTPSVSDKLAQRNLAIVESANPGIVSSRRIPQTFEIRPSPSQLEPDELMIDWGNVPYGSVATLYVPGINMNEVLTLAARKYRSHKLVFVGENTIKFDTGGITYLPIPPAHGNLPGLLTVDLPEGIEKRQVFSYVVRQVSRNRDVSHLIKTRDTWRQILGSFQMTIPVQEASEILPKQLRLLSNLRWIEWAIPENDRWSAVFSKYVSQVADRVDALGGDSGKVTASPSGQWERAYITCLIFNIVTIILILLLILDIGLLSGGLIAATGIPLFAVLVGITRAWVTRCRPKLCLRLRALLISSGLGAILLALSTTLISPNSQLTATMGISAAIALVTAITCWVRRCY